MGKTSKLVHGNAIDVPQGYFIYFVLLQIMYTYFVELH